MCPFVAAAAAAVLPVHEAVEPSHSFDLKRERGAENDKLVLWLLLLLGPWIRFQFGGLSTE